VTVTLWDETFVTNTLGSDMPKLQLYARDSMLQLYREAGIDINLYRDEPGLEIDRVMGNSRDRGGHGNDGVHVPVETQTMYRDFDFLDQPAIDACAKLDRPGAFIFNCWVEAWGDYVWFRPEDNDPHLAAARDLDGQPAEGIFVANGLYPKDGFWWNSQLRITPAFQGGMHFLEPYAEAVADLDACRITRGGLFLDKSHSEMIQGFARAYRALPRRKFETVGATTDPVAVRTLLDGGRRYFYAINRDYYPIKLEVVFNGQPVCVEDLATGHKLDVPRRWNLAIGPYELRSFVVAGGTEITGFTVTPPEAVVRELRREAEATLAAIGRVRSAKKSVAGMNELESGIRLAMAEGRWAWLRRALTSYAARKCRMG
jgi:hypothetical protein